MQMVNQMSKSDSSMITKHLYKHCDHECVCNKYIDYTNTGATPGRMCNGITWCFKPCPHDTRKQSANKGCPGIENCEEYNRGFMEEACLECDDNPDVLKTTYFVISSDDISRIKELSPYEDEEDVKELFQIIETLKQCKSEGM